MERLADTGLRLLYRRTQARITIGVPAGVRRKSLLIAAFGSRMQPWEAACPITQGSFVPWIPIGPPCAQSFSTGEKADVPRAAGPNGPFGSLGTRRSVT